jgi:hypothetical protein
VWIILLLSGTNLSAQTELQKRLESLPGIVSVTPIEYDSIYTEAYKIFIRQPVDHNNLNGEHFTQKLFLSHIEKSLPMVIELDGYGVNKERTNELSQIIKSNKIIVEHRYFGESVPGSPEWKYLTIKQAADDHHKIIELFKTIYSGKWITTGISKGGQTAIFHKYFYPDDAIVTVPYVAPLNLTEEDPRIYYHLNTVGSDECRNKITLFQREVLKRADELVPLFRREAEKKGYTYSIGNERMIFEYIVLEYDFAFWQWAVDSCEAIPSPDASNEKLFDHLERNSPLKYFSDQGIEPIAPFFYQAYNEIGYYGYDITDLNDLLKEVKEPTSKIFIPKSSNPNFNCSLMQNINTWVQKHGNNMLFIYGEYDTWSAPAVQLTGETNAIKMIKKEGSHRTRIKDFSKEEKEIIYSTLEKWLDIEIRR